MDDFRQIIGRNIDAIYLEPTAIELGIDDTRIFKDFIFVGSGSIFIKVSNDLYVIGSLHATKLATDYLGISKRNDLLEESKNWQLKPTVLDSFNNKLIGSIDLLWNREEWTNYSNNERYLESLQMNFKDGQSLSIFCGDFEENNSGHFNFLAGRSSLVLFPDEITFDKYKLNKVLETEKLY